LFVWRFVNFLLDILYVSSLGAFRLYDVDNDGFITREEMYNIVDAIYQMVVSLLIYKKVVQLIYDLIIIPN